MKVIVLVLYSKEHYFQSVNDKATIDWANNSHILISGLSGLPQFHGPFQDVTLTAVSIVGKCDFASLQESVFWGVFFWVFRSIFCSFRICKEYFAGFFDQKEVRTFFLLGLPCIFLSFLEYFSEFLCIFWVLLFFGHTGNFWILCIFCSSIFLIFLNQFWDFSKTYLRSIFPDFKYFPEFS